MGEKVITEDSIYRILAKISYKPGWGILINEIRLYDHFVFVSLKIATETPDSLTKVNYVRMVTASISIPNNQFNWNRFVQEIREVFTNIELHERDEWLKYKGKLFYDPHELHGQRTAALRSSVPQEPLSMDVCLALPPDCIARIELKFDPYSRVALAVKKDQASAKN